MNVVSFSGGKDSTAMLLRMLDEGVPVDRNIFADTTLELPEMYGWIDAIERPIRRPIERLRPRKTWDEHSMARSRAANSSAAGGASRSSCKSAGGTGSRKYTLLDKAHAPGDVVFIGIAADEAKRAEAKQYRRPGGPSYRFPLIEWGMTEVDCHAYLEARGPRHPLKDFPRTGCWLCPKQSMASLRLLYLRYPDLWERLLEYEADSPHGFKPRFSLREFAEAVEDGRVA